MQRLHLFDLACLFMSVRSTGLVAEGNMMDCTLCPVMITSLETTAKVRAGVVCCFYSSGTR